MAKGEGRLTAQGVKNAAPGVHGDGGGLYLRVKPDGRAGWTLRYQLAGVRRDLGLGRARGVGAVTLAEARSRAVDARRLVAEGRDPLEVRAVEEATRRAAEAAAARTRTSSFKAVAEDFLNHKSGGWKNDKHSRQWEATLSAYAYPAIGSMDVAAIGVPDVLRCLRPIWDRTPETAGRVRGRIEAVLSYAAALDLREKAHNAAAWRGNLDAILPPLAKMKARVREAGGRGKNHPALPWSQMPAFMRALAARDGAAALALKFAILTAARTGEVIGAGWEEVDEAARTWTVPAERMKGGEEHVVPLSEAALAVLAEVAERNGSREGPIFSLSDMALLMTMRRMQEGGAWTNAAGRRAVPHGMRSAFRDWASEQAAAPREVAEAALAHTVENATERAYARGKMLERRRALMTAWARWCAGEDGAQVITLRPGSAA